MPKLGCRCGFTHNLTPIPDDGFVSFPDAWTGPLLDGQPADLDREEMKRSIRHLYECPNCGALHWQRSDGGEYQQYVPSDTPPRVFVDFDDTDDLGGVHLRHPRGLQDIEEQRLILGQGLHLVIYDDARERLASAWLAVRARPGSDDYEDLDGAWVAREPL